MTITPRLLLRPPTTQDADAHFEIHAAPETNRHNPAGPLRHRWDSDAIIAAWRAQWKQDGFGYWAVRLRAMPDRIVGFGGIARKPLAGELRTNLYFRLSPAVWGRGVATELGQAALALAEEASALSPVFALVRPGNTPSIRVLERLGLSQVSCIDDVLGAEPSLLYGTQPN